MYLLLLLLSQKFLTQIIFYEVCSSSVWQYIFGYFDVRSSMTFENLCFRSWKFKWEKCWWGKHTELLKLVRSINGKLKLWNGGVGQRNFHQNKLTIETDNSHKKNDFFFRVLNAADDNKQIHINWSPQCRMYLHQLVTEKMIIYFMRMS